MIRPPCNERGERLEGDRGSDGGQQTGHDLSLDDRCWSQPPTQLFGHQGEIEQGGPPPTARFGDGHGEGAQIHKGVPERRVETGGLGRPDVIGRR